MSQTPQIPEGSADTVEIGTIGTISSLMSQELDTVNSVHASSSFRKKNTTAPISASISVSAPKSARASEKPSTKASSGEDHNTRRLSNADKGKQNFPRNGRLVPIPSEGTNLGRRTREKMPGKKGHGCLVEIVDVKCNNPMSSRLKKLGFSKLSETTG
ncbi:hypothetical protein KSP39_PZI009377 [Platanthera zijinensis]|uniref:Uncharacterized protein n=1 Tax=Platanthera zijinensis TaxID=2320716 RepID=A0AAP0BL58_9ASPA